MPKKTIIIKVEHLNVPPTPLKTFSVPTRHLYFRECISATALTLTLRKTHYPSKNTIFLPPLSKGGGLTARHKLLLCCFLLAICPLFLYCKLFCRQDGGIALHHRPFQNRTIPRKRGGSVARSSRANYGGDCSCLEVVSLIPLVLFLFHIDRCTHSNSEPEKCYLAKRTIGSLLS